MIKLSRHTNEQIEKILQDAMDFSKGKKAKAKQEVFVSNLFFESSTRTKMSFEVAEKKLGLHVVNFDDEKSSLAKGESLYDTIKTLESIGIQAAVIRHPQNRYFDELKEMKITIINAGDGTGNHPSQALLDALTIIQEFGKIEGLNVGIVGDVKHSRVANSTAELLRRFGAKVSFSGPEEWFATAEMMNGVYRNFDHLLQEVDVLILLRIQHERHTQSMSMTTHEYLHKYGLTKEREQRMKEGAIIMHPAPINRGVEIEPELVECKRSRVFKQMENGVYARMAILKDTLEKRGVEFEEME